MSSTQTVYGVHAVRALLERHADRVVALRIAATREEPRVRDIESLARERGIGVQRIDPRELKRQLGDVAHQGVVAEVRPLTPWTEDDLLDVLTKATAPVLLLVLDGVQDPHNLGACLRTADACGALAVIVPKDRAAQMTPTVKKVAAGAAETTPVVAVTNLVRALKLLKEANVWIVGADAEAEKLARDADLRGSIALVLGSEGAGLRQLTRQTCDFLVRLPQLGSVESLNVSVATGMLLYEALRQRGDASR